MNVSHTFSVGWASYSVAFNLLFHCLFLCLTLFLLKYIWLRKGMQYSYDLCKKLFDISQISQIWAFSRGCWSESAKSQRLWPYVIRSIVKIRKISRNFLVSFQSVSVKIAAQPEFTCSKSTLRTPEQCPKSA